MTRKIDCQRTSLQCDILNTTTHSIFVNLCHRSYPKRNMNNTKSLKLLDVLFMAVITLAALLENFHPLVYLLAPEGRLSETVFLKMTKDSNFLDVNLYLILLYFSSLCSLLLYGAGLMGVYWSHRLLLSSFFFFNIVAALFEIAYEEPFLLNTALALCTMLYCLYCFPEEESSEESTTLLPKTITK